MRLHFHKEELEILFTGEECTRLRVDEVCVLFLISTAFLSIDTQAP